jgi:hypothetical protein
MAGRRKKGNSSGGRLVFIAVVAVMLVVIYRVGYSNPPHEIEPEVVTPVTGIEQFVPKTEPDIVEMPEEQETDVHDSGAVDDAFYESLSDSDRIIYDFAAENGLSLGHYPRSLRELLERNPETEEFVLNYPFLKDVKQEYTIPEMDDLSNGMPLLLQWDTRWGYKMYGNDMMGLTGCGPTCLSMVAMYLLNDNTLDPGYMAQFSIDHGYCVPGNGSMWTLISEGGELLGLEVEELDLYKKDLQDNLEAGNPIIMVMGPGDFTRDGHFIVVSDYINGKLKINDPNSRIRSEKLWEFEKIENQVSNLWALKKAAKN